MDWQPGNQPEVDLISDTVLLGFNVKNVVYTISWARCNGVWIIHENLNGIFMWAPVQLGCTSISTK